MDFPVPALNCVVVEHHMSSGSKLETKLDPIEIEIVVRVWFLRLALFSASGFSLQYSLSSVLGFPLFRGISKFASRKLVMVLTAVSLRPTWVATWNLKLWQRRKSLTIPAPAFLETRYIIQSVGFLETFSVWIERGSIVWSYRDLKSVIE